MAAIAPCYGSGWATTPTQSTSTISFNFNDSNYSSNIPDEQFRPQEEDQEELAKEGERLRNNVRSLEGMRTLHADHSHQLLIQHEVARAHRAQRPTCRRTMTATKNWRRT